MVKRISFLLVVAASLSTGQSFWERTEPYAGSLNQLHFAGGDTVYGSLNSGMTRSFNGGVTWSSPIIVNYVRSFDVSPNGYLFVAQNQNKISRSTNKGVSFSPVATGINENSCSAVLTTPSGTVLTSTQSGIYRSTNNGDSWTKVAGTAQLSEDTNIVAFAKNQNTLFAFATMPNNNPEWTVAYRSTDDGLTWKKGTSKNEGNTAYKFIVSSNGDIYSRTHRGVYRSTDHGDSWSLFAFQDVSINDISLNAAGHLYVTIDYSDSSSHLYKTTDGGNSWSSIKTPYTNFSTISIGKNGELFLRQDQTYRSTDDGATWQSIAVTYPNVTLFKESPKQELFVTAGGSAYQNLYRSADFGVTWKPVNTGVTGIPIVAFYGDTLLVADNFYPAKLYRSTNNGETFKSISGMTVISGYINALIGTSYASIIAGTSTGIYRSIDHGKTWVKVFNTPVTTLMQLSSGTIYGYRTFSGSGILRSNDSGSTWQEVKNGMGITSIQNMVVEPSGNLLAGTNNGLFRSTNSGDLWIRIDTQKVNKPYGIFVAVNNEGKIFFGGATSGANTESYQSTNLGATWSNIPNNIKTVTSQATLRSLFVASNGRLFAGTSEGLFRSTQKTTTVDGAVGISPEEFSLYQNYPNPFNPTTTISFSIRKSGMTKLQVYDLLGKEVAMLVNEELTAGSYQRTFNAAGFSSGMYFFRLTNGSLSETKRMMLLK